jgi:hypothetical protein
MKAHDEAKIRRSGNTASSQIAAAMAHAQPSNVVIADACILEARKPILMSR